jgi:hypothetical protein
MLSQISPAASGYSGSVGCGDQGVAQIGAASTNLTNMSGQIGQLLRGVGGGAEDNRMLQMMIGLMILMAVLQGSSSQPRGGADLLGQLMGPGSGGGSVSLLSSTSISIEQTSMTVMAASPETLAAIQGGSQPQQDPQIDLTA